MRKAGQAHFRCALDAGFELLQLPGRDRPYPNLESPYAPLFFARDQFTPRQRAVLNVVWEIPVGKGRRYLGNANRFVNGVVGGWQFYWIGLYGVGPLLLTDIQRFRSFEHEYVRRAARSRLQWEPASIPRET